MLFEEFEAAEPDLARTLKNYVGKEHTIIDGVYQREDGRWEAHVVSPPSYGLDIVIEARCRPNCRRASDRPYIWCYEDHACCRLCEVDPAHLYQDIHE